MDIRFRLVITEDMLDEKKLKKGIRGLVEDMTYEGVVYLLGKMPYATGRFLRSIKRTIKEEEDRVIGEIWADPSHFPEAYYPIFVELGTKPHKPPLEPLITWAMYKFGWDYKRAYPFAKRVQGVIARRGTKAQNLFLKTTEELRKKFAVGKIDILRSMEK